MRAYFDYEASRKVEGAEYLKGAKAARQFILEDKYTLLRGLIGDFTDLFGRNPQGIEAQTFLEIMRDEFEAVKSDLCAIYGRQID